MFGTSAQIRLQLGNKNILFNCRCVAYNGNNLLPGRLNKPSWPDFNTEKSSTSVLYIDRRRVSLRRSYFTILVPSVTGTSFPKERDRGMRENPGKNVGC